MLYPTVFIANTVTSMYVPLMLSQISYPKYFFKRLSIINRISSFDLYNTEVKVKVILYIVSEVKVKVILCLAPNAVSIFKCYATTPRISI